MEMYLALVVAIVGIASSVFVSLRRIRFLRHSESLPGEIVGFEKKKVRRQGKSWNAQYARIRFTDRQGKQVEFVEDVGVPSSKEKIGDRCQVRVDLQESSNCRRDSFLSLWILPLLLLFIGLAGVIAGWHLSNS